MARVNVGKVLKLIKVFRCITQVFCVILIGELCFAKIINFQEYRIFFSETKKPFLRQILFVRSHAVIERKKIV